MRKRPGAAGTVACPCSPIAAWAIASTVRAIRPIVSREGLSSFKPAAGKKPKVGLKPATPQYTAGLTMDPVVCVPKANGTIPPATAAAEPLDDPPGVWLSLKGLRAALGV